MPLGMMVSKNDIVDVNKKREQTSQGTLPDSEPRKRQLNVAIDLPDGIEWIVQRGQVIVK